MKGFRPFLMRGNLIDLAVAVVIGTAFTAIVTAIVKDLITPLIAAIGGKPDFGKLHFTVHGSSFAYGDFINALVSFVIIAAVVYFLIVAPVAKLTDAAHPEQGRNRARLPRVPERHPVAATRCKYCTAVVTPRHPPSRWPGPRGFGPVPPRRT